MCKRYLQWKVMESARSIFLLQQSASESELLKFLRPLTVPKLKVPCKDNATNFGEQGRYYQMISYVVEGSMQRFSRDVQHNLSRNHWHACIQRNLFVDEGPIAAGILHLYAAVPLAIWPPRSKRSKKVYGGLQIIQGVQILCRWFGYECLDTQLAKKRQQFIYSYISSELILLCISQGKTI